MLCLRAVERRRSLWNVQKDGVGVSLQVGGGEWARGACSRRDEEAHRIFNGVWGGEGGGFKNFLGRK